MALPGSIGRRPAGPLIEVNRLAATVSERRHMTRNGSFGGYLGRDSFTRTNQAQSAILKFGEESCPLGLDGHMQRRDFLTVLGGAAAAWPLVARAQQAGMPVIGFLNSSSPDGFAPNVAAFRNGLGEMGFVEGRNVAIEYRFALNDNSRLPELAADLVRRRVSAIAAVGGVSMPRAAKAATTTIPIVFEVGSDPVQDGLVASFNRPGGNITGVTAINAELDPKRLGLLAELLPKTVRIGALVPPTNIDLNRVNLQKAAASIGRQIEVLAASNSREVDDAFSIFVQRGVEGLLVGAGSIIFGLRAQIATAAARYAIPAIYSDRNYTEVGGLMSYGTEGGDNFRLVGVYVGRILKGEKPADLPVMRPVKFEFFINLQTARLLRIEVPSTLLALADKVIE
jgi:putative ABC transport system substrate-binding protein